MAMSSTDDTVLLLLFSSPSCTVTAQGSEISASTQEVACPPWATPSLSGCRLYLQIMFVHGVGNTLKTRRSCGQSFVQFGIKKTTELIYGRVKNT
jgi:hypothetical protein